MLPRFFPNIPVYNKCPHNSITGASFCLFPHSWYKPKGLHCSGWQNLIGKCYVYTCILFYSLIYFMTSNRLWQPMRKIRKTRTWWFICNAAYMHSQHKRLLRSLSIELFLSPVSPHHPNTLFFFCKLAEDSAVDTVKWVENLRAEIKLCTLFFLGC